MTKITEYTESYKDEVIDLIVNIQRNEFSIPITSEQQPDLHDIGNFYQHGAGNFWIALHENRVIGTISILDIGCGQAALRKMFVDNEYRGSETGVATLLLSTLLDWCESKKVSEVFLGTTEKFFAAHRFYEKSGFIQIPAIALPSNFPVMAVDSKFYRYDI